MEILEKAALLLHIAAGHIALISGLIVMIIRKGDQRHQRLGRVFYYSLLVVSASALLLSLTKENWFLLHIGIFVFYQAQSGFSAVQDKSLRPGFWSYLLLIVASFNALLMLWTRNPVLLAFGGINLGLVTGEIWLYIKLFRKARVHPKQWLARHIGMMVGAYIGTFTAFLVVNINMGALGFHHSAYTVMLWLLPTAVLVPLLIFWQRKFASRSKRSTV